MTKTKTLSDLIDACKFYYVNENIKKLFFLEPVRGKVEIKSFAKNMSSEDVIAELTKDGYVPANFTELLTYYAENQPRKDIVALGSIVSFEGGRRVPYVWLDSAGRYCILDWFGDDWVADCWFAYIKLEQTKNNAMKNNHRDLSTQTLVQKAPALEHFDLTELEKRVERLEKLFNPKLLS